MKFVIATQNKKKLAELERILAPLSIAAVPAFKVEYNNDVEESGSTFEENARLKAEDACKSTGYPAIADDSGLVVDALNGAPGVYSARYAGEHGNDLKNTQKLLAEMKDIPQEQRTARFVSAVCCVFPDGRSFTVRGECEGKIGYTMQGTGGFGYDPVFMVGDKSFGELTSAEKDALSHRGKALKKLAQEMPKYL